MTFSSFPSQAQPALAALCDAHGGLPRWNQVRAIHARLDSGGFAFASRWQPRALRGLRVTLYPHEPRVVLDGFGRPGWRGEWRPGQAAWLDPAGQVQALQRDPWGAYRRPLKQLRWDRLDILHFAGYALWNYLSFPFLLTLPGVRVAHGPQDGQLRVDFPDSVPTHSARQTFWLDGQQQLLRHDYTAMAIGSWAHAANFCHASAEVAGLRVYTRRRVLPTLGGRVLGWPLLVWIELQDLQVQLGTG